MFAFGEALSAWDQLAAGAVALGLGAVIHGFAYHTADGALRVPRQLLMRGADLLLAAIVAGIVLMVVR